MTAAVGPMLVVDPMQSAVVEAVVVGPMLVVEAAGPMRLVDPTQVAVAVADPRRLAVEVVAVDPNRLKSFAGSRHSELPGAANQHYCPACLSFLSSFHARAMRRRFP